MQDEKNAGGGAMAGLALSCLGLLGWIGLAVTFQSYDTDAFANVFRFGMNAILLIGGGGASAALSLSGFVASSVSHSNQPSREATAGMVVGVIGLATGLLVVTWRMNLVFG